MIIRNEKNLVAKFHGDREIIRKYHGENLVWEKQGGELPAGYTKCLYLESSAKQYILTDGMSGDIARFYAVFNMNASGSPGYGNVFGARYSSQNHEYQLTLYQGGTISIGYRNSGLRFYANVINTIYYDGDGKVRINGTEKTLSRYTTTENSYRVAIFAINEKNKILQMQSGKIYNLEFGEIAKFIPAIDPNGRPCMFDTVSSKAYYNQGSGEFGHELEDGTYVAPI